MLRYYPKLCLILLFLHASRTITVSGLILSRTVSFKCSRHLALALNAESNPSAAATGEAEKRPRSARKVWTPRKKVNRSDRASKKHKQQVNGHQGPNAVSHLEMNEDTALDRSDGSGNSESIAPTMTVTSSTFATKNDCNDSFFQSLAVVLSNRTATRQHAQMVLLLCGIPGSGKSTISRRILSALPASVRRQWVSLNQDVIGPRKKMERLTEQALAAGSSVIIDRCNFDAEQRAHWVRIAAQHGVTACYCVVVPHALDINLCVARAFERGSDGIHAADTNWLVVCRRMRSMYREPHCAEEQLRGVLLCRSDDDIDTLVEVIQRSCIEAGDIES